MIAYGDFLVYAGDDLERECKTLQGARRCGRKILRLGFRFAEIKRHARDGARTWNERIEVLRDDPDLEST